MTIVSRLIFLFCIFSSTVYGQTEKLILTSEQNNKWLDSLKTSPLNQQLFTVKERLLADTNVFVKKSYSDGIKLTDSLGNRVYGDSKPTLIIGGYPITIDNKTETSKIIGLTELLTIKFIKAINVLSPNDPTASALNGSASSGGIIVMTLTKKKYLKKFTQLKLKPNY